MKCQFDVEIDEAMYFRVCIWDTKEEMYAHSSIEPPYAGCYDGDLDVTDGCIGTVHLLSSQIGAGYVAHELQHVLIDWIDYSYMRLEDDYEDICWTAGQITSKFWSTMYTKFEWLEPGKVEDERLK